MIEDEKALLVDLQLFCLNRYLSVLARVRVRLDEL